MAALPSPTQVAGPHSAIYEAYYHQVDPNGTGAIQALDAAKFLKKSRLSDVVLSKIWDLSDPSGKGYLDRAGLYVALKLVALAQAGKDINMSNIHAEAAPPKVGDIPKVLPTPARPPAPAAIDWTIKPQEREKYCQLFDSLQPANGLIPGNKVKGVLMESKLPVETLGKIWDLADQDKDGQLDKHEFIVAMHLVYKALEKHAVPTSLPPSLRAPPTRPPSRPHSRPPSPARPPPPPQQSNADLLGGLLDFSSPPTSQPPASFPTASLMQSSMLSTPQWVVGEADKRQYDAMFTAADADRDGYVSGIEIKHVFLDSGLPQQALAHIWGLCDGAGCGKLSRGQFALAMWLVRRAQRGLPPPDTLAPDMLPPPSSNTALQSSQSIIAAPPSSMEPALNLGPQPTASLDALAREVESLARERLALQNTLSKEEPAVATNQQEAQALQSELDTLLATLKQLENQKGEAQKRLNDLKSQAEKLRSQVAAQESAAADTETEVRARRAAALSVREKETALQQEAQALDKEVELLTRQQSDLVLLCSQANIKLQHLEEHLKELESAVGSLSAGGLVPNAVLDLKPRYSREALHALVRGNSPQEESNAFPNKFGSATVNGSGFSSDPFNGGFDRDPFAPSSHNQDAFVSNFSNAFGAHVSDPFAEDSFNDNHIAQAPVEEEDPFAILHAPPRGSSPAVPSHPAGSTGSAGSAGTPAPALPPKKAPPPRPKPPKAISKSTLDFTEDPFKDYRYEDPYNIEDPFSDEIDSKKLDPFNRPTSVAGLKTDDLFGFSNSNGTAPKPSGRVSAPPVAYDPFGTRSDFKPTLPTINNNDSWAAWPNDNWATEDAWNSTKPVNGNGTNGNGTKATSHSNLDSAWGSSSSSRNDVWGDSWTNTDAKNNTNNWPSKNDNWAAEWNDQNQNKNLNETWPSSNTLPNKKEKSPKPVKYAKSLVHTIGGIGRTKHKEKKNKDKNVESRSNDAISEDQQWAWAAAESRRLEQEAEARRRQEDAELQLALAISRQEK